MHRGFLTIIGGLALLGCGDDLPTESGTGGSSGTTSTGSTTDGSTTTSDTTDGATTVVDSTGVDSTGPGAVCGNGVVDPGEDCDDEDLDEDDACYSDCTIPYEELWTSTYDDGADELGRDARFDAEGNLYVLGWSEVDGEDADLWLRQYQPDGTEGWTWTYDGPSGGVDTGTRMEWHPSGDLVIVGSETTDQGRDILVLRLDVSTQSVVWSDVVDGPDMGRDSEDNDFGNAITVDADGSVLVAGTIREVDQEGNLWLRRYDADGNALWTITHDEAGFFDSADAVLVDDSGDIYLVGLVEVANGDSDGWIRKLDSSGTEIWTNTLASVFLTDATLDADGNLVLVGFDLDVVNSPDIWVAKFDPDFNEIGSSGFDGSDSFDFGSDVVVGSGGDLYVSGSITIVGEQDQIWAARYTSDATQRWWRTGYGNERANLTDEALSIAVSDDESRVAVVGYETVLGQGRDVWVRMLQNNPTPMP